MMIHKRVDGNIARRKIFQFGNIKASVKGISKTKRSHQQVSHVDVYGNKVITAVDICNKKRY